MMTKSSTLSSRINFLRPFSSEFIIQRQYYHTFYVGIMLFQTLHSDLTFLQNNIIIPTMQYLKPTFEGPYASVIKACLSAVAEISAFMRHSPIVLLESQNKFGDVQLHQDIACDEIVEKWLRKTPEVKGFASQQRPDYHEIAQGDGYVVTYDPLDGSSIIDTNFAIGSIFSIWKTDPHKLIGYKLRDQVNAMIAIYGPRTTVVYYNETLQKVQEYTLIDDYWIISHDNLNVKSKTKIFSPGNLRSASDNDEYAQIILGWIKKGYTLRYTGGMVPDINQIFIKGNGIFSNVGSPNHKCKLRALYEAAAVGFLIEKAGGKTITTGKVSLLEFVVQGYDDRLAFAVGSAEEIDGLAHLF